MYSDRVRVLTRRWNYRDCDFAKITEHTEEFVLMIEAPTYQVSDDKLAQAAESLCGKYKNCFDGSFSFKVATPDGGSEQHDSLLF